MKLLAITEPEEKVTDDHQQMAIGIDLGTTNSLVAISLHGEVEVIASKEGDKLVSSVVAYDVNEKLVGRIAKNFSSKHPYTIISSIKRLMGKAASDIEQIALINPDLVSLIDLENSTNIVKLNINGKLVTPVEISAEILKELKKRAEEKLQTKITQAVITVPAYFDDAARTATKDAAQLAGLEVLRLINEPTAAALAYGLDNQAEGTYLIYDFGGGTFDISILKMEKGIFQVLATGGNSALGGDDFDIAIAKNIIDQNPIITEFKWPILQTFAKEIREELSSHENVSKNFIYQQHQITYNLTRDKFNHLISPFVEQSIKILYEVLADAKLLSHHIKDVVLVGGVTRTPYIQQRLTEVFTKRPIAEINPDEVVAVGAALQAENLTRSTGNLLLDVVPLSLGLEIMGGMTEKIILRNTPLPVSVTKEFTTYKDSQQGMKFHIVQGEREMAPDCRSLAFFELRNLPNLKAGIPRVALTFTIDADGLLTVTAHEKISGSKQEVVVKPSYGLDEQEIIKILKEAMYHAEEDIEKKLLLETKIDAERVLYAIKNSIKSDKGLIKELDLQLITEQIANLETLIMHYDRDAIIYGMQQLEQAAKNYVADKMDESLGSYFKGQNINQIK